MYESYNAAIILWPATPLPANVAAELHNAGVDLTAKKVNGGRLAAKCSPEGTVVLDLTFESRQWGLDGMEAVLATLRLARISYVAWDVREGEIAGTGREFQPERGIERYFSVMADGEPILTASDLEEFEGRFGTAETLLNSIRGWLRLPTPEDLTDLGLDELSIPIVPEEEDEDDDRVEIIGAVEDPPSACLAHAGE
ncbi:MAG: hypothetical protein WBV77_04775 [Solirubrobacteraceae bacterium]